MGLYVFQARHCLLIVLDCIFKDVHIANSLARQKVFSSRTKSKHAYCLPLEQRAGILIACNKIFEISELRVFFSNKTHYVNKYYVPSLQYPVGTEAQNTGTNEC